MADDFRHGDMDEQLDIERWLTEEEASRDETAEAAFAQLFAAIPRQEVSAEFVERSVHLAWRARSRARVVLLTVRIAAGVFIAASIAAAYALATYAGAPLIAMGAAIAARVIVDPVLFLAGGLKWWSLAATPAAAIGHAMATPQAQVALVSREVICACAVYAMHRLLRMDFVEAVTTRGDR